MIMNRYMFYFNKSLLDLGAVEMDDMLKHVLNEDFEKNSSIKITNEAEITKDFKINRNDNLLEGRGLKSFFKNYSAYCYSGTKQYGGVVQFNNTVKTRAA